MEKSLLSKSDWKSSRFLFLFFLILFCVSFRGWNKFRVETSVGTLEVGSKVQLLDEIEGVPRGITGVVAKILPDEKVEVKVYYNDKSTVTCNKTDVYDLTGLMDESHLPLTPVRDHNVPPTSPSQPNSASKIKVGNKVRLLTTVDNCDAGTSGFVEEILQNKQARVKLIHIDCREITCNISDLEDISSAVSGPGSSSDLDVGVCPLTKESFGPWPYWLFVLASPWYNIHTCEGPIVCEGSHSCGDASDAFYENIAPPLKQVPVTKIFSYNKDLDPKEQSAEVMKYVTNLLDDWHSRLYNIGINYDHAFLIEQYDQEFRIYQSFVRAFDLQFWTDPAIHISQICEPGYVIHNKLQNDTTRQRTIDLGLTDDREMIDLARSRFGGLKSIRLESIIELIQSLTKGFELEATRIEHGDEAILPASESLGTLNSNVWLGKSAIRLDRMVSGYEFFEIEISYIQFDDEKTV